MGQRRIRQSANLNHSHVCHGNKVDICHVEENALQQPRELSATHRGLFALCVQFKYGANAECPSVPQPCQESNTHVLPHLGCSCKRPLIGSVTSWAAVEAVRAHAVTSWLPCNIQGGRNTDIFRRSPYPIGGDSACEPNYL